MAHVLIIGIDPKHLDLSTTGPQVAEGITEEVIITGLTSARDALRDRGHTAEIAWTDLGETATSTVADMAGRTAPDLVVIGAGIRMVKANTALFEDLVNTVTPLSSGVQFAFNSEPGNTLEAALRHL
ncbi:hypothetical protein [Gordonia shandongensis]|uniref:hypothetical protein n=1 Tax=Gordonia shandongensis TaxID=376351 RepID=UPI0003F524E9|nr:hypothetical protein [Gordonia shandongensis]